MITDSQTNTLYLADALPKKYSNFYNRLEGILNDCKIKYNLLSPTKDIWAVDYMPVQTDIDTFVQFVYDPDYLKGEEKWRKSISDVDAICKMLNISQKKSNIILDGGNVVRATDKVIMCDKVFYENPHYNRRNLIRELENLFKVDKIIFIPTDPADIIGHADGMVRFLDDETVLINRYSQEDLDLQDRLRLVCQDAGIDYIEIPYNPYSNKKSIQANGIYINYLQMKQAVVIPTFGIAEDEIAMRQFEDLFRGQTVATIDSNDIARDGGVLHCISWSILSATDKMPV